jgi:hypothetical protein
MTATIKLLKKYASYNETMIAGTDGLETYHII